MSAAPHMPLGYRIFSWSGLLLGLCLTWTGTAGAQPLGFEDILGGGKSASGADEGPEAEFDIKLVRAPAGAPGNWALQVTLKPSKDNGSYVYSTNPSFGGATRVKDVQLTGLKAVDEFKADHAPKTVYEADFKQDVEKYTSEVVFTQHYQSIEGATKLEVAGRLEFQACNAKGCRPMRNKFSVSADIKHVAAAASAAETPATPKAKPVRRFELEERPGRGRSPKPALVRIALEPADAKPGAEVKLTVKLTLDEGWHTYSTTQKEGNAAEPTVLDVSSVAGLEPTGNGFVANKDFEVHREDGRVQEIFEHDVTWTRSYRLGSGGWDAVKLAGSIVYQTCNERGCLPAKQIAFEFPITEDAGPTRENPAETTVPPPNAEPPSPAVAETPATTGGASTNAAEPTEISAASSADIRDQGLLYVLGAAFLAGFAALLTPCVFPMVPITVSFFLKQTEAEHAQMAAGAVTPAKPKPRNLLERWLHLPRSIQLAFIYCGSIVATFTVLGLAMSVLFGAASLNELANSVGLNLFLSLVLLFFAFNLLGLFEIQIPAWLLNMTASKEAVGGYLGVVFMALTFTLTSFTCTFAFLGLVLVWAAQGSFWTPLLALISFATAFALPFFFLALFPQVLKKLPRSGGWMNRVKVVMGLVEMAFMFKFLSVADVAWFGSPALFDYHLVMSAWMIIAISAGLYLLGKIRLSHDTPTEHTGAVTLVIAMSFLGLASYLAVGLFGNKPPEGIVWQQIAAFAPPQFEPGEGPDGPYLIGEHDRQVYLLDIDQGIKLAKQQNMPLFLDFTGVNCINCRRMEKLLAEPHNLERLKSFVRVQLYTDTVPLASNNEELQRTLLARNRDLQENWYEDAVLPGYAVVTPDGKTILSRFGGLESRTGEFAAFLDEGLDKFRGKNNVAAR